MDFDEERPIKGKNYSLGDDLGKFSVDELKVLLSLIDDEKRKIKEELKSKLSQKQEADSFFRK